MPARTYLIDTSILSQLIRQPQGPVAARIAKIGGEAVVTSIVVACELRYGVVKRGSRRLTRQVEAVLEAFAILPLDAGTDRHYAAIRTTLERKGTPIGAHDMLIAAHTRSIGAICVTANVSAFKRVPALKVENWRA